MPILVDGCDHYELWPNICRKCGRSMPEVCLESEETTNASPVDGDTDAVVADSDSNVAYMDDPTPVKRRGRSRKDNNPE